MDMPDGNLASFDGITILDEPFEKIVSIIRNCSTPGFSYVVTPNADHFFRLSNKENHGFTRAYEEADLRICDSRIIQKLSRFEEKPLRHVTPGSDLTRYILESSWAKDTEMLLIGPEQHEVEQIRKKYSLLKLKYYTPPMGFIKSATEVQKCIDVILASEAKIVFLAVGSPQQEILAHKVKKSAESTPTHKAVMLCIGASFDFLSGKISRAPKIIQKLHLEWLHRALSDPKRLFPRYWKNFTWITQYIFKKQRSNLQ